MLLLLPLDPILQAGNLLLVGRKPPKVKPSVAVAEQEHSVAVSTRIRVAAPFPLPTVVFLYFPKFGALHKIYRTKADLGKGRPWRETWSRPPHCRRKKEKSITSWRLPLHTETKHRSERIFRMNNVSFGPFNCSSASHV